MGYTHYWRRKRPFTPEEWEKLRTEAQAICERATAKGIVLVGPMADPGTKPEFTKDDIVLNGRPSCESFVLSKDPDEFDFCKTRRAPYDAVVVSILHAARTIAPEAIDVSSDGGPEAIKMAV